MNKSKILTSVLAMVLALSVVVSFAACSKKGGEEGTTSVVEQAAPADAATPQAQTFDALLETVFESSDLQVDYKCSDGETSDYDFNFGNGLEDSNFELVISKDLQVIVAGTELKIVKDGEEASFSLLTFLGSKDLDLLLRAAGVDGSVLEMLDVVVDSDEADKVINDGKIERSAIAYIYDEKIRPNLEIMIQEEFGAEVKLPTFEDTIAYIREFLNTGVSKEALNFTVVEETNGKVTYNVTFNMAKLVEDFGKYVMKHTELLEIAKAFAGTEDGAVQAMFNEMVEEAKEEIPGGNLQVTIDNGRLTKVVCTPNGGDTYTFEITSAKK